MERDVLVKLESIEKKVDYVYKRVKEIEEFVESSLPLLSEVSDRITDIISKFEEEVKKDEIFEKLKKIKEDMDVFLDAADKILEAREQFSSALEDIKNVILENIEMEISPEEAISLLRKLIIYMPTLSKIIDDTVSLYNLIEELKDVKIAEEVQDSIKEFREKFEREEVLVLLRKLGDILPKLPQMLDDLLTIYNLIDDLRNVLPELEKEAMPTISELRERFEREEVLDIIKKLGDFLPRLPNTIDNLLALYEIIDDLKLLELDKDELDKLKSSLEKINRDEFINLVEKLIESIPVLSRTIDIAIELNKSGMIDFIAKLPKTLEPMSKKLSDKAIEDIGESLSILARTAKPELATIVSKVSDTLLNIEPKKVGLIDLMRALSDRKVQVGLGVSLELLRALADAVEKLKMVREQQL